MVIHLVGSISKADAAAVLVHPAVQHLEDDGAKTLFFVAQPSAVFVMALDGKGLYCGQHEIGLADPPAEYF